MHTLTLPSLDRLWDDTAAGVACKELGFSQDGMICNALSSCGNGRHAGVSCVGMRLIP